MTTNYVLGKGSKLVGRFAKEAEAFDFADGISDKDNPTVHDAGSLSEVSVKALVDLYQANGGSAKSISVKSGKTKVLGALVATLDEADLPKSATGSSKKKKGNKKESASQKTAKELKKKKDTAKKSAEKGNKKRGISDSMKEKSASMDKQKLELGDKEPKEGTSAMRIIWDILSKSKKSSMLRTKVEEKFLDKYGDKYKGNQKLDLTFARGYVSGAIRAGHIDIDE